MNIRNILMLDYFISYSSKNNCDFMNFNMASILFSSSSMVKTKTTIGTTLKGVVRDIRNHRTRHA